MTTQVSPAPISVRRGLPADLPQLAELVDRSFAEEGQELCQLSRSLPHLFTPARAGDYFIAEMEGRMVATIGLYPYPLRAGPVIFQTAGVGQVSTLPEARGKGAMTSLLRAVCQEADRYDFTWLYGDRLRYGRYGWTAGGWTYRFETGRRYLPPPPEGEVEVFNLEHHLDRLQNMLARLPQSLVMPDEELRLSLHGQAAQGLYGAFWGRSFVLGRDKGEVVLAGDGDPGELGALLAHLATGRQQIHVDCAYQPSALLATCLEHYSELQVWPSASFRVGNLASFLRKAAELAGDGGGAFQGRLGLVEYRKRPGSKPDLPGWQYAGRGGCGPRGVSPCAPAAFRGVFWTAAAFPAAARLTGGLALQPGATGKDLYFGIVCTVGG